MLNYYCIFLQFIYFFGGYRQCKNPYFLLFMEKALHFSGLTVNAIRPAIKAPFSLFFWILTGLAKPYHKTVAFAANGWIKDQFFVIAIGFFEQIACCLKDKVCFGKIRFDYCRINIGLFGYCTRHLIAIVIAAYLVYCHYN